MSYDVVNGFTKQSFEDLLQVLTTAINEQFNTDYTTDTIVGSNHFKFFYGGLQLVMESQNKINDLMVKVADYIRTINESISEPVSTPDGAIRYFKDNLNLDISLRPITDVSLAGQPAICVDIDPNSADFDSRKQQIFDALRLTQTEGLYWFNPSTDPEENEYRGESSALNGQAFPYAFKTPTASPMKIRITVTRSRDNLSYQLNSTQIADLFRANFEKLYSLGRDFEGSRYLSVVDVESASAVKVEWSINDGSSWSADVREMEYDTKITITDIEVVEG